MCIRDRTKIAQVIEGHPYVKAARVSKHYPCEIRIEIMEREPIAIVNMDPMFLLDESGFVLPNLGNLNNHDLPIMSNFNEDKELYPYGSKAISVKVIECISLLSKLKNQYEGLYNNLSEIKMSSDNEIIFESTFKVNDEKHLEHWELCEKFDIVDFELGNKVTGSGFPVYKGKGATLQRALINYFLDKNTSSGYTEVQPPVLVNEESAFATGQLPDKEGQMYHINNDDLYLIPTAEVPITNFYRNSIITVSYTHLTLPTKRIV